MILVIFDYTEADLKYFVTDDESYIEFDDIYINMMYTEPSLYNKAIKLMDKVYNKNGNWVAPVLEKDFSKIDLKQITRIIRCGCLP